MVALLGLLVVPAAASPTSAAAVVTAGIESPATGDGTERERTDQGIPPAAASEDRAPTGSSDMASQALALVVVVLAMGSACLIGFRRPVAPGPPRRPWRAGQPERSSWTDPSGLQRPPHLEPAAGPPSGPT